jgi:hypothetical protein
MNDDARSEVPAWWETLTFTHGPETEWFARSVFAEACRAGKTIYWSCSPARGALEPLHQRLMTAGFRLVLEHRDRPRERRGKEQLHRVYVRAEGDSLAVVNREGAAVTCSTASFDKALAERLAEPVPRAPHRRARRRAPHQLRSPRT